MRVLIYVHSIFIMLVLKSSPSISIISIICELLLTTYRSYFSTYLLDVISDWL